MMIRGKLLSRWFSISIVLITLNRCNKMKDTPGATTLNMKNMVKSAHLAGGGAKYNELML
jgi:hypothetical protein